MALLGANGLVPAAIAGVLDGRWLADPGKTGPPILGASIDTRSLDPGEIFFALRGEHVDGHAFLGRAAEAGSALAVVDREDINLDGLGTMGVVLVGDARGALGTLGRAYRDALADLRVVGVTGSNGKTTTVRLLHAALSVALPGSCSVRSFNNDLGLPLTLLAARPGDAYVVCEMGTNAPGEMAGLVEIARPDIGVIASIGRSHLESLGSVEGVAREKAELVRSLPADGLAVVCADSPALDTAIEGRTACPVRRVGLGARADTQVENIERDRDGVTCVVAGTRLRVPMPGAHNAVNAAMAFEVALWMGVDAGVAAAGIASVECPPMRLERVEIVTAGGPVHLVNDAYNANPESMRAAVGMLARGEFDRESGSATRRRIAVLGAMLELGGESVVAHDELAGVMIESGREIDGVVLIGPHADRMASAIEAVRPGMVWSAETDAEVDWASRVATCIRPGDVVLLKGSRGMRLERLVEALRARLNTRGEKGESGWMPVPRWREGE